MKLITVFIVPAVVAPMDEAVDRAGETAGAGRIFNSQFVSFTHRSRKYIAVPITWRWWSGHWTEEGRRRWVPELLLLLVPSCRPGQKTLAPPRIPAHR